MLPHYHPAMLPSPAEGPATALPALPPQPAYWSQAVALVLLSVEDPRRTGPWQGLPALLDHLFREGISAVVLSSGRREDLAAWLQRQDCLTRLPMRICGEELPPGAALGTAPALACRRLAVSPRRAVAIVDGARAAADAAAAGCTVIAYGSPAQCAALRRTGADAGVNDLARLVPITRWNYRADPRHAGG